MSYDSFNGRGVEKLLQSETLSAMILDQAGEAIIVCDESGRIIRASRAAHKLCGIEILKQQFDRVFTLQMADESRYFSVSEVLGGEAVDNAEMIFSSASGTYHLLVNSRPLNNNGDGIVGCILTLADITARKEVEERLEQRVRERTAELAEMVGALQKEIAERKKAKLALKNEMVGHLQALEELRQRERLLIQQSRQAAMGEMIGNIAHQWRQPLNTLGLYIQEMPIMYDFGEFTREYLHGTVSKAMQLVFHMSQTIDDFRNFFKPNREKELFSLRDSIMKTISLIDKSFVCHGINIKCEVDEDLYVEGYFNEFSQVMLNILNNAKDVIMERGIVNPLVHVELSRKGKKAAVKVADNAGGIAENVLENLFDPYFTTKGPVGTGVGLFMSKVIIEKSMNGRLTARNISDGAEFTIEVPHRPPPPPE